MRKHREGENKKIGATSLRYVIITFSNKFWKKGMECEKVDRESSLHFFTMWYLIIYGSVMKIGNKHVITPVCVLISS